MKLKRIFAVLLAAMVFTAGCGSANSAAPVEDAAAEAPAEEIPAEEPAAEVATDAEEAVIEVEDVTIRIGAMSGATAMGMVKLKSDAESGQTVNSYEFAEFGNDASAFVSPLAKGEIDIAAVPSNLASNIYNNTEGGVQVLAVGVLGVLNLVERGENLSSVADLAGCTVYATGAGAVPEYTIRYLLSENGIDPDNDVELIFCSDTTEALSHLSSEEGAIAILPQPFVTAACAQVEGLRVVQDLNDAWASLENGCEITTGVIVVRTEFAEQYPNTVAQFLVEYQASVQSAQEDVEGTANLIAEYGIIAKAPLAQKALPNCHIVCLTGNEMKDALQGFLQVLFDQNPKAVGGALPGDDFYYGAE